MKSDPHSTQGAALAPMITVIVPLHNGRRTIGRALRSIQNQSYAPTTIIVVDDHSDDGSDKVVGGFPGVTMLKSPGKGEAVARDFGIERAKTQFVAFLNQDEYWHPDHLIHLLSILANRPNIPLAFSNSEAIWSLNRPRRIFPPLSVEPNLGEYDPWEYFPVNYIVSPSNVLVRRSALDSVGGWPTAYPIASICTWLRLSTQRRFVESNQITVFKPKYSFARNRRMRRPAEYMEEISVGVQEIMRYRLAHAPAEALKLRTRLDLYDMLIALTRAMLKLDDKTFTELTARIEDCIVQSGEGELLVQLLIENWWHFVRGRIKVDLFGAGDLLELIDQNWSPDAKLSKRYIDQLIYTGFDGGSRLLVPLYPLTAPWKGHRWSWLRHYLARRPSLDSAA